MPYIYDSVQKAFQNFGPALRQAMIGTGGDILPANPEESFGCDGTTIYQTSPPALQDTKTEGSQMKAEKTKVLTKEAALGYAHVIDLLHQPDPRKAMVEEWWKKMYCCMDMGALESIGRHSITGSNIGILRITKKGETAYMAFKEAMPCHNCGILLPVNYLEVDHYMPKASHRDAAVLKMLRLLGLTIQGPSKDTKAGKLREYLSTLKDKRNFDLKAFSKFLNKKEDKKEDKKEEPPVLFFPNQNEPENFNFQNGNKFIKNKWVTTAEGSAFLTLLCGVDKEIGNSLRTACTNSYLNLVPLCTRCNLTKNEQSVIPPQSVTLRSRIYAPKEAAVGRSRSRGKEKEAQKKERDKDKEEEAEKEKDKKRQKGKKKKG